MGYTYKINNISAASYHRLLQLASKLRHKIVSMIRKYHSRKTAEKPHDIVRKSHTTITRHQKDKQSKAISSLIPIEMLAKLEWTQAFHSIDRHGNHAFSLSPKRYFFLGRSCFTSRGGLMNNLAPVKKWVHGKLNYHLLGKG